MNRTFLDASELVTRYGGKVTLKTLSNWRSTGAGPTYVKIGGRVMYPLNEVEAWEDYRQIPGSVSKQKR